MKFPGNNTLSLEDGAVQEMFRKYAPAIFGDADARITKIATTGYPARLEITFTTDPDPMAAPPAPRIAADARLLPAAPEPALG
jgi:hypothetical protein